MNMGVEAAVTESRNQQAGLDSLWLQKAAERQNNTAFAVDLKIKYNFFFKAGANLTKRQT